jgi:prephenate dehydratase
MDSIALLGPEGTYTEKAAESLGRFEKRYRDSVKGIFDSVYSGDTGLGIFAIENSTHGMVLESLDTLINSDLYVVKEILVPIHHCLASNTKKPNRIYSHPQAISQCSKYLANRFESATIIITKSTAAAMAASRKEGAAIGSEDAARLHGLQIIEKNIEDYQDNRTRFFAVSKQMSLGNRSAISFGCNHVAGSLYKCLEGFYKNKINLLNIVSRPIKTSPWQYSFFIEFLGDLREEKVESAISVLRKNSTFVKLLGSYS